MPNWLDVNPRSGVPIYVQLVQQITHALEIGILQTGDQLPTVRQLASELTIAPNTIVKAYDELARLGLVESRQGVGTLVTANLSGALRQHQLDALFGHMGVPTFFPAKIPAKLRELTVYPSHRSANKIRLLGTHNAAKVT